MNRCDMKLTDEAAKLDKYLNRYRECINIKHILEHRRQDIVNELSTKKQGAEHAAEKTSLLFSLEEIDTRLERQINTATNSLMEVMNIVDLLPENSVEREIIESRYIDRLGWDKICQTHNMTKTPAIRYWRKGLYRLLEFKRVKKMIEDCAQEQEAH